MVQRKNQLKKRLVKFDISQYQYLYPTHERMFHIIREGSPQLLGRIGSDTAWVVLSRYHEVTGVCIEKG